jgi:ATP-dependent Lhr-like helicase
LQPRVTGTAAEPTSHRKLDEAVLGAWFAARGWTPQPFQRRVWRQFANAQSGLLHAGTGSGKTLAVWLGALLHLGTPVAHGLAGVAPTKTPGRAASKPRAQGLRVLWITPMRALAADTYRALTDPLDSLGVTLEVGLRTGDTGSAERARQDRRSPFALVTTPESLSVLLARSSVREVLGRVAVVIVDEWHELMGSKRGVQVQLALARVAALAGSPPLVWGLSATLGNPHEALEVLLGDRRGTIVQGGRRESPRVDSLAPTKVERFPWAGHLGAQMRDAVVNELDGCSSALVFCNTRAQAELWYSMLLEARPDWAGAMALHHGSLAIEVRRWVEQAIAEGRLRCVVCTSSLDLGVDFSPVERVLQIGSAKGVARLVQRAGRSGHRPGARSRITLVPTHAIELIEAAAARDAVAAQALEPRRPPVNPIDVLVQHLVTVASGEGFDEQAMLIELRRTHAYRLLDDDTWRWALAFVTDGGSLAAYPEYRKLKRGDDGLIRVADPGIARRHRMSIGTIVADASIEVKFLNGARIGLVEENFIARMKPGDRFLFGGRTLELVRVHEMSAWVRRATGGHGTVPRWSGGRMPLSAELAQAVLARLDQAAAGRFVGPEMTYARGLLQLQARWSRLPGSSTLLVERLSSREGHHLFVYPFAGRHANLGLACLLAWRAAKVRPATLSIAVNDYGFELLGKDAPAAGLLESGQAFSGSVGDEELLAAVNAAELSRRRFREIARIAGLVFQGHPRERRSAKTLQASATMFHDVFVRHDPSNQLLAQAQSEVLQNELDAERLRESVRAVQKRRLDLVEIAQPTPFSLPLMVERLRETLSNERLSERVSQLVAELEEAARC